MWGSLRDTEQKTLREERSGPCPKALGDNLFFFEDKQIIFLLRPQNVHPEDAYVAFYQRIRTNSESQMKKTLLKNCSGDSVVKLILLKTGHSMAVLPTSGQYAQEAIGKNKLPIFLACFHLQKMKRRLPGANFFVHLVSGILIYKIIIVKTWKRQTRAK